jgi:FkbM family methyltransferase
MQRATNSHSYAQFGEDLEILQFFANQDRGYYVEVGANDGVSGSNTALLEENGWTGLLIEANPDLIAAIAQARPNSQIINCAAVADDHVGTITFHKVCDGPENLDGLSTVANRTEFNTIIEAYGGRVEDVVVPARTLDDVFTANQVPEQFQLLSIDVEGVELSVLQGLNLAKFNPRIILIEDNSRGVDLTIANYLKAQGYVRVHRTGVNDWYVRTTDARLFLYQRLGLIPFIIKGWLKRRFLRPISK